MLSWPDAAAIIAMLTALSFIHWTRRAYDKSPTLHIIRAEKDEDHAEALAHYGYQMRDKDMIQQWHEDDEDV